MVTEIGRQNQMPDECGAFTYFDSKLGVKFMFDPTTLEATVHGTESDFPEQLDEGWTNYK